MTSKPLYTPSEVATLLGVTKRTVYRMIAGGEFRELVDISRRGAKRTQTRIPAIELERYIARKTRSIA